MALRLDTAVIRGEIDNTSRDNVRGKLWLVGRDDPVTIDLRGNAWRDVAGCKVTFTNPNPSLRPPANCLHTKQKGHVGDISTEWQHALYLEWFSEEDGRVFIEGTDFEVSISAWVWEMDEAQEEEQKTANLSAMRNWLAGIIQRPEPKDDDDNDDDDDSEEAWENSLKQSDRLTDANMEAIEKYGTDGLHDGRIPFVMGWDHMLGGSGEGEPDDDDEEGEAWKEGPEELPELEVTDELDDQAFSDFLEEREREAHPLQTMANDFVLRLLTEIKEEGAENTAETDGNTPLDRFIRNSMNISGKLAGALGTPDFEGSSQTGHTLAILRRCLNWANEAFAALNELMEDPDWKDRQELLNDFRAELFAIRDGIIDLRQKLRAQ